jgi:hypothetical protein
LIDGGAGIRSGAARTTIGCDGTLTVRLFGADDEQVGKPPGVPQDVPRGGADRRPRPYRRSNQAAMMQASIGIDVRRTKYSSSSSINLETSGLIITHDDGYQ